MTALLSNNVTNQNMLPFGYVSGAWYMAGTLPGMSVNNVTETFATGTLYYIPIIIPYANNFTAIGCSTITAVAGASAVLGVYASNINSSTGQPMPIQGNGPISGTTEVVSIATSAHGNIGNFASSVYLSPGLYFLAYSVSANAAAQVGYAGASGVPLTLGIPTLPVAAGQPAAIVGYKESFTYSTTLPAAGGMTNLLEGTNPIPFIALQSA